VSAAWFRQRAFPRTAAVAATRDSSICGCPCDADGSLTRQGAPKKKTRFTAGAGRACRRPCAACTAHRCPPP
jgi:hypothetical protein